MTIRIHWGIAVAVFYTAFALATVGFVAFAMTQDVELVNDDYYARSLEHDGHVQAIANAEALGASLAVETQSDARIVRLRLPSDMAPHVRGAATMYRPSNARADRTVPIVPAADGTFVIPTDGLDAGIWRLKLAWRVGERAYYAERALELR